MNSTITHIGFADESYWNIGRFRSVGLVTLKIDDLDNLSKEVHLLLQESKISEFRWKNLDGAKERFGAEKLCKFAIDKACDGQLRVDVLVWDIEDSRHKIPQRDDIVNLERMYYHLFRNVLRKRWPNNATWRLHPDEHTALDWETVQDCLENVSANVEVEHSLFTGGQFRIRLRREFGIEEIQPVSSEKHPLLQLADLFAGMAVFSRDKFGKYHKWLTDISPQVPLFPQGEPFQESSRSEKERFQILQKFNDMCKWKKIGVSLKSDEGLWTPDPKNPINFWIYEAQHQKDKAPQKGNK